MGEMRIISGLEMVQYNNNQGVEQSGGCLEKLNIAFS